MAKATLNKQGIATKAGDITVYNFDGNTGEYLTSSVEFLAVGVGIPANSCTDGPIETKDGFAVCRMTGPVGWEYKADHRGEKVYDKETGQSVGITGLGDYPASVTTLAPLTPYDYWGGNQWITDEDAQKKSLATAAEQKKSALLTEAQNTISLWQTELQLSIISKDDKTNLITWMKYIQALNLVDTSPAPDIRWPIQPD